MRGMNERYSRSVNRDSGKSGNVVGHDCYKGLSKFAQEYLEDGRLEDNFNECPED